MLAALGGGTVRPLRFPRGGDSSAKCAGGACCKSAEGDSHTSGQVNKDPHNTVGQDTRIRLTSREDNEATINVVLKGRATSTRHTHRVNLARLQYQVRQHKHLCADVCTKVCANYETRRVLLSDSALFDMSNQKITKLSSGKTCSAQSRRDARLAMGAQQSVHESQAFAGKLRKSRGALACTMHVQSAPSSRRTPIAV